MGRRRQNPPAVFQEAALAPPEQLQLLISKGMIVEDPERARFRLEHINYHRLRPYWHAFQTSEHDDYRFREGTSFEGVFRRYRFDRKLRLLMLDASERLEISLRSRWSNHMALRHGPLCLANPALFRDSGPYRKSFDSLLHFYGNTEDEFVVHFKRKYPQVQVPPIWICSEMLSLGQLCRWMSNLREVRDQVAVSSAYGLEPSCLFSFLEHMTEIRNLAAHHWRLWNRSFPQPFELPDPLPQPLDARSTHGLYNTVAMLHQLLESIAPANSWARRLAQALERHPEGAAEMRFPRDWRTRLGLAGRQYQAGGIGESADDYA